MIWLEKFTFKYYSLIVTEILYILIDEALQAWASGDVYHFIWYPTFFRILRPNRKNVIFAKIIGVFQSTIALFTAQAINSVIAIRSLYFTQASSVQLTYTVKERVERRPPTPTNPMPWHVLKRENVIKIGEIEVRLGLV